LTTTCESTSPGDPILLINQLANTCTAVSRAPRCVLGAARRTLVDTIGVAAAGSATRAGRASLKAAPGIWGDGDCGIWFSGARSTAAGAAFVNATYAAALDLDDGHRQASGHPAAAIVPSVLAHAGQNGASSDAILTAIAIGYEVAVRVSRSRDIGALRTTDSGLWCGYGVAAAVGWLSGVSAPVMGHALAIAGQTSTSQTATAFTRVGHTVKEGIPWATANGLQAVMLAVAGHRGPIDMLDEAETYAQERLIGPFEAPWAIQEAYFKLYSCCRWAHAAIDGALALQESTGISHDAIEHLEVETFERALSLPNQAEPQSPEAAQYSIPFCVALALVHGASALLPMDNKFLADTRVTTLAKRIRLSSGRGYASAFPASTPARVTISAGNVIQSIEVRFPRGEPQDPLTTSELHQKFERLAVNLGDEAILSISRAVNGLGIHQQPSGLFAALGGGAG